MRPSQESMSDIRLRAVRAHLLPTEVGVRDGWVVGSAVCGLFVADVAGHGGVGPVVEDDDVAGEVRRGVDEQVARPQVGLRDWGGASRESRAVQAWTR